MNLSDDPVTIVVASKENTLAKIKPECPFTFPSPKFLICFIKMGELSVSMFQIFVSWLCPEVTNFLSSNEKSKELI